jgi:uncharacterized protein (TIGR03435 family)
MVSRVAGRPVVDKTGIEGRFAYKINTAPLPLTRATRPTRDYQTSSPPSSNNWIEA